MENILDKELEKDWLQQRSRAMGMQRQRVKVLWDRLLRLVKIKEQKRFEEKKMLSYGNEERRNTCM